MKRKVAVLLVVLIAFLGWTSLSVAAKRRLPEYNEVTPSVYVKLDVAEEEKLNEYLKDRYSCEFIPESSICVVKDKSLNDSSVLTRPVLVSYKGETSIIYTEQGKLMCWNISEPIMYAKQIAETAHTDEYKQENKILLGTDVNMALVLDTKYNIATYWEYGKATKIWELPKNAVYCGKSPSVGYVFRDDSDVYAITVGAYITSTEGEDLKVIAHNVKKVVVTNYNYDQIQLGVPLFLMNDGTLKAYVRTEANIKDKMDSEKRLKDPVHEGGYWK